MLVIMLVSRCPEVMPATIHNFALKARLPVRQGGATLRVVTDGSPLLGRRERKKLATRHALSSAALQLAVERGLENVTIEDITARADVAVRTFSNYFASKYEAICAIGADRARQIGMSLLERPAGEPLWEALTSAVLQHYEGTDQALDRESMAAIRLIMASPAMR